jgi:hypothetical protein
MFAAPPLNAGVYATLEERSLRVTRRTRIPSRASMSIRVSVLNRSMRPLNRSLTLGCVTRRSLAACACLRPRSLRTFSIWIMRSARIRRCSDASGPKPRSRKTLPRDRTKPLRFATFLLPSHFEQVSISISRLLYVSFWGLTSPLFDGTKDVNALREPRHVEHPVFRARADPDFLDAGTHRGHPLPIVRLEFPAAPGGAGSQYFFAPGPETL